MWRVSDAGSRAGAGEIAGPRPFAAGGIIDVFRRHRHIGKVPPAMGYSGKEPGDLAATISAAAADAVIAGTPTGISAVNEDGLPAASLE